MRALRLCGTTIPLAATALRAPRTFPLLTSRAAAAALLTVCSALGRAHSCCPESRAPGSCCACSHSALPGADFISLCKPGAALWTGGRHMELLLAPLCPQYQFVPTMSRQGAAAQPRPCLAPTAF
ncbi:calcium and integrin binding 1 (calmyrin) [Columba livia]|uniref:Calcium and integrin binding 1 (Calmyrin) n=1 Tax=Columba livia TaxID=8932 RepID=A0A2I0LI88_COLLI|nr:calcium and integrin binding 1 (calmyrin) [Columba livia]